MPGYVEADAQLAAYQAGCLVAQPRVSPTHTELNGVDRYMAEPPVYDPDFALPPDDSDEE